MTQDDLTTELVAAKLTEQQAKLWVLTCDVDGEIYNWVCVTKERALDEARQQFISDYDSMNREWSAESIEEDVCHLDKDECISVADRYHYYLSEKSLLS